MKMKSILLVVCGLLLTHGLAFAGLLGPAQATGKGGTLSFGPGLALYSGELEGGDDYDQTLVYAQLGYSLTDRMEIYVQGGGADIEVGDIFEDGFRPFGAAGFKAMLTKNMPVDIGLFAQGSIFSDYEEQGSAGITGLYEVTGGLVFQGVLEGAVLYGGPYFFMREADAGNITIEEDSNLGGFVGIRWPLDNGITIDLEGHARTGVSFGADILYSF